MKHAERCYGYQGKCGRFAPKPVLLGTITTPGFPSPMPFYASKLCSPCAKASALADKRRAVLARNLRKVYGD